MPLYALGDLSPTVPAGDEYYIAPDAVLIGDVRLSRHANVWFNSVLRGDNEPLTLGEGSNIQDGCICHADPGFPLIVGDGVTIGHKAMIHGCTIGSGSLIGMSAIVMNGARIGQNCIIGAGTLVREGQEIPDNSLAVGVPARVVRQTDEKATALIRLSAESYVSKIARYRDELKEIG